MYFSTGKWVRAGGLAIAIISFGVTRVFVAEAVEFQSTQSYFFGGLIPLIIGLAVTIYGVVLSVGNYRNAYVNSIAWWTVLGTIGAVVILTVTFIDPVLRGDGLQKLSNSRLLVANVLLGGTVSGIIIGTHSARNQRQERLIKLQANQSRVLTRLLRHEVLNAITIIQGHAQLLTNSGSAGTDSFSVIERATARIEQAIETVDRLAQESRSTGGIDLEAVIENQIADAEQRFPDVSYQFNRLETSIEVAVDHRIEIIIRELLENASEDPESDRVTITLSKQSYHVRVTVTNNGDPLPDKQRELLRAGEIPEFDDPSSGFGLPIVRLLVRQYDGEIDVVSREQDTGTEITVSLPRAEGQKVGERSISLSSEQLLAGSFAGVLAGVIMGIFFAFTTDILPVIGALYGTRDPTIGWVTHLFHSVMFALVFVAVIGHPSVDEYMADIGRYGFAGLAWGAVLWLLAAGVIMPLWLKLVGIPSPLPNLPRLGFLSHAMWGSVLGVTYGLLRSGLPTDRPTDCRRRIDN